MREWLEIRSGWKKISGARMRAEGGVQTLEAVVVSSGGQNEVYIYTTTPWYIADVFPFFFNFIGGVKCKSVMIIRVRVSLSTQCPSLIDSRLQDTHRPSRLWSSPSLSLRRHYYSSQREQKQRISSSSFYALPPAGSFPSFQIPDFLFYYHLMCFISWWCGYTTFDTFQITRDLFLFFTFFSRTSFGLNRLFASRWNPFLTLLFWSRRLSPLLFS